MSTEVTLICDCCGTIVGASKTSTAAVRAEARRHGARVNLPGGKDMCSWCATAGPGHEHSERMLASRKRPGG